MKSASVLIIVVTVTISSILLLGRPKISYAEIQSFESPDANTNDESRERQIVSKEREGLDALKTGNLELFGNLTADDAVFVDTQGPASKAQVLKNVSEFRLTEYSMEDIKFVSISPNAGLISYEITEKGVSHGKEFAAQVYVSSVWAKRGSQWVCLFSQETRAKQRNGV
jgi:hypothetical protein